MATKVEPGPDAPPRDRDVVFRPAPEVVAASQLTAFRHFCEAESGRSISGEEALYRFSVDEYQLFWRLFLAWSDILREGVDRPVCAGDSVEFARFFPNLHLNYAENLLRVDSGRRCKRSRRDRGACVRCQRANHAAESSAIGALARGFTRRAWGRTRRPHRQRYLELRRSPDCGAGERHSRCHLFEHGTRDGSRRDLEPVRATRTGSPDRHSRWRDAHVVGFRRRATGRGRARALLAASGCDPRRRRRPAWTGMPGAPLGRRCCECSRRQRRAPVDPVPVQPSAVHSFLVRHDWSAEVHHPRGRRHAPRTRQGTSPARRSSARRQTVFSNQSPHG